MDAAFRIHNQRINTNNIRDDLHTASNDLPERIKEKYSLVMLLWLCNQIYFGKDAGEEDE